MDKLPRIESKTLPEWHAEWATIAGGLRRSHPQLRYLIGVYRVTLNREVMFIGCAREINRGLAKRLRDFTRPSRGGRDHHAGELIHEHRKRVEVEVIVTGIDQPAPWTALQLKQAFLTEHRPPWNVPDRKRHVRDGKRQTVR